MAASSWNQQVKNLVKETLSKIISEDKMADYIAPEVMPVWEKAFTHETFAPSDNYEELEYLGDAILAAVFPKFLMEKFPKLHKNDYTVLNTVYMNGIKQAEISRRLGFGRLVRTKGLEKSVLKVEGDVFESFFGALSQVSDIIVKGLGFSNCFNMIYYIYEVSGFVTIDEEEGAGAYKTMVQQTFSRFDLPPPIEISSGLEISISPLADFASLIGDGMIFKSSGANRKKTKANAALELLTYLEDAGLVLIDEKDVEKEGKDVIFEIRLGDKNIDFMQEYGSDINITNKLIAKQKAKTKKEAETLAYKQAYETISAWGFSKEKVEIIKRQRDFLIPELEQYMPRLDKKIQSKGFIDKEFFMPKKTKTIKGAVILLVGIREDGTKETLDFIYDAAEKGKIPDKSHKNAKIQLVKNYLKK